MGLDRNWTQEEDNLLRRLFQDSSFEALAEVLDRTVGAVKQRCSATLKLKKENKFEPIGKRPRNVNLIYKGEIVKIAREFTNCQVVKTFSEWLTDVKPALQRGERVTVEIEMD